MENQKFKVFNTPSVILALFGLLLAVASLLTITPKFSGISSFIIFNGSLITTLAAIVVPLFSIKKFNLDSYKIKIYSLSFGIIFLLTLYILDIIGYETIEILKEYSKKGLLWGMNTALLLFNLTYLEIENHGQKHQELTELLKKKDEEIIEQYEIRLNEKLEYEKKIEKLKK